MTTVNFAAKTVRTIPSPSVDGVTTYIALVPFDQLPDNIALDVNPRKPKMTTAVAKQLIAAVQSADNGFDINNRGIVIRAKKFNYKSKTSMLTLDLGDDTEKYGIVDGGHTYTAITQHRDSNMTNKFVKLEILVGENLNVSAVADARNTSVQVSDIALFELDNKFDFVKEAIKDEPYKEEIAYKDNDKKAIPISDLLRLMFAFNISRYPNDSQPPIPAYSSKAAVFKDYRDEYVKENNIYKALAPELPTLVRLYEKIELDFEEKYVEYKTADSKKSAFGKLRGVKRMDNGKIAFTEYTKAPIDYTVSYGYVMPIFGAFRALLKLTPEGTVKWDFDPIEMWNKYGTSLVQNTFDTDTNPNQVGKNKTLWQANYRIVDGKRKDMLIEKLTANME